MRQFSVILCLLAAGCDVLQAKIPGADCSSLASEKLIRIWRMGMYNGPPYATEDDRADDYRLATDKALADCLIVQSRELSSGPDVTSIVARGVLSACQSATSDYVTAYEDDGIPDDGQWEHKLEKNVQDAAIRYVLEARTGRCAIKRNDDKDTGLNDPEMPEIVT